jgi:hypothetical protein
MVTEAEIERLMAAARKASRYGHRDATMIVATQFQKNHLQRDLRRGGLEPGEHAF